MYKNMDDILFRQQGIASLITNAASFQTTVIPSIIAAANFPKSTLEYITRGFLAGSTNTIPQTAINSWLAISSQNARMAEMSRSFTSNIAMNAMLSGYARTATILDTIYQRDRAISQIASLQTAIAGLSGHLAHFYALNQEWDSLDDFAAMTSEVADIEEQLSQSEYITKEHLELLKVFFTSLFAELKLAYKSSDAVSKFSLLIGLISLVGTYLPFMLPTSNKADAATQQEIQSLQKELSQIHALLKEKTENRIVNRKCKVYLKPKSKGIVIDSLSVNLSIVVLQNVHQWCYIGYINQHDGLTENGWVLKKYLFNPSIK